MTKAGYRFYFMNIVLIQAGWYHNTPARCATPAPQRETVELEQGYQADAQAGGDNRAQCQWPKIFLYNCVGAFLELP